MIVGSGLLAQEFARNDFSHKNVCVYAAGVSNSHCVDAREFARERQRLESTLKNAIDEEIFMYFGTCSVADPDAINTPYVQHKLAMEQLVSSLHNHLILRLPQVAGRTPNPHTLLNFLYARISRSERFELWRNAKRNVIDVADVVAIARYLIEDNSSHNAIINIANTSNYSMLEIVGAMEEAVGKPAIYDIVERGSEYTINVDAERIILDKLGLKFNSDYLKQIIRKYYRSEASLPESFKELSRIGAE